MKKSLITIALLLIIVNIFAFDELWQKAQKFAENSWNLVPGKIIQQNIMKDLKSNEDMNQSDIIINVIKDDMGFIKSVLEKAIVDGQEVNESNSQIEMLLNVDRTPNRKGMFLTNDKKDISVKRLRQNSKINDLDCIAYEVSYTTTDDSNKRETLKGTVWLASKDGRPVLAEMEMAKTPMFVQSIKMNTHYGFDNNTQKIFIEKVDMDVNISALGKRMHNKTIVTMSDYWEYKE